jgi:hypothetical protein
MLQDFKDIVGEQVVGKHTAWHSCYGPTKAPASAHLAGFRTRQLLLHLCALWPLIAAL